MKIFINKVDKTDYYIPDTLSITDEVNSRSTCTFRMVDTTGVLNITDGYQIEIYEESLQLFGGFLTYPKRFNPIGTDTIYYDISCVDNNSIADRRIANYEYAGDVNSDDIVTSMITDYLEDEEVWYNPYSLLLDSTNYITCDMSSFDVTSFLQYPITLQAWVRPTTRTSQMCVCFFAQSTTKYFSLEISSGGYLQINRCNTTEYTTTYTGVQIDINVFTHIACEITSATTLNFYINGILVSAETGLNSVAMLETDFTLTNYKVTAGGRFYTAFSLPYIGYIDEFRITNQLFEFQSYNKEIPLLGVYENSLYLTEGIYWKFNNLTGTVATGFGAIFDIGVGGGYRFIDGNYINTPAKRAVNFSGIDSISEGMAISNPQYLRTMTISEILTELSEMNGFIWYIDFNKQLVFTDPTTIDATYDITDSSAIRNVQVKHNNSQYRNKQIIRGAYGKTDTISLEKPTPKPDSYTRNFVLSYPISEKPAIFVNAVAISSANIGIKGTDTGKKWYFQYNTNIISQDTTETILTDSDIVTVTYKGYYPILISSEDIMEIANRKAISGGTGLVEMLEDIPTINDINYASNYSDGIVRKYKKTQIEIEYETFTDGLFSGMYQNVVLPKYNVDSNFLIDKVEIRDFNNGSFVYFVHAVSGYTFGSWQTFFGNTKKRINKSTARETESLVNNINMREGIGFNETNVAPSVYTCDFPSATLFPSLTRFPC